MMDFLEPREELLAKFGSDATFGMTDEGVKKNAALYGLNVLTRQKPETLMARIKSSVSEPTILLLIFSAALSVAVNVIRQISGGEADFLECIGIVIAISLSVVITIVMEGKSSNAFEALSRINDDIMIRMIRNGRPQVVSQKEIVAGDILLLATGSKIPADGRVLYHRRHRLSAHLHQRPHADFKHRRNQSKNH